MTKGTLSTPLSALASHDVHKAIAQSVALAIACLVSYELITQLLGRVSAVSRSDDLLAECGR